MTAVEWLVEQYEKAFTLKVNSVMTSIVEQAKEMEKNQMKEMYLKGIENYDPSFKRKDIE